MTLRNWVLTRPRFRDILSLGEIGRSAFYLAPSAFTTAQAELASKALRIMGVSSIRSHQSDGASHGMERFAMTKQIPLKHGGFALVDDEDFDRLNRYSWRKDRDGYAIRSSNGRTIFMHRMIMQPPPGLQVDHINGNKADNHRRNLRLATHSQQMINKPISPLNTSGFRGVQWRKALQCWRVRIQVSGRAISLGDFDDITEAARAYNAAAIKYHGEFAQLNSLEDE